MINDQRTAHRVDTLLAGAQFEAAFQWAIINFIARYEALRWKESDGDEMIPSINAVWSSLGACCKARAS